LHELDGILDALERLNLTDSTSLPEHLQQSLKGLGLTVPDQVNVTDLIERIWELQERYLGSSAPEGQPGGGGAAPV